MADPKTVNEYLDAVRAELADMPAAEREDALAELDSLLRSDAARAGEVAAIADLGSPHEYAHNLRSALLGTPDETRPQGRILGMPYDFRGVSVDRIGARVWNPADPRVFMPRLFGLGWTINLGAVAVRLGLLRPDDAGDDVFDRIPPAAVAAALTLTALLAVATVTLVIASWRSLPPEVPSHWGVSGAPDDLAPKVTAFGMLIVLTVVPVVVTYARILRRGTTSRVRVLSAAALAFIAALGLGLVAFTIADADGGNSGGYAWAVILGGLVVSFLLLYVPVRLGLRAEWREGIVESDKGA